jgi:predicted enzyme related to lactoylglutathione lyase
VEAPVVALFPMTNQVVHFEILGSDGAKLIDFYREVFGWPLTDSPLPGWPKYGIMEADQGIGGAVGASDAAPDGGVLVYVEVDDLGSYLDRAVNGGATIAMPATSVAGTTLTVAWIRDPQGNLLGLVNRRA